MHIQVAHANRPTFGIPPEPQYPSDYTTVATVEVPDDANQKTCLGLAFGLTNHINGYWWENQCVTLLVEPEQRSTSIGDVVILPDGRKFRCEVVGWKEIF